MRLATFNVMHGRSPSDGLVDLPRLREVVAAIGADVLGLQEVDRGQPRSNGHDLTAEAAAAMGGEGRFAPAMMGTPGERWRPVEPADPAMRALARDTQLLGDMSDRPALDADAPDQQAAAVKRQPRVSVEHEDLQWVKTASPPHSEVFLLIKPQPRRVTNLLTGDS